MIKKIIFDEYFYIVSLSILLPVLISFGGQGLAVPTQILRGTIGLLFVLFFPGYCLQAFAMPAQGDLDGKERLALSFGLSLALIPLLALILDRLPWGITLETVVISLLFVILPFSFFGILRRSHLPEAERFLLLRESKWVSGWRSLDSSYRVAYIILGLVLLIMGFSAVSILTATKPAERLTEFYLLGPEGEAELYPQRGMVGREITVTLGIRNLEGTTTSYRVEAHDTLGLIGEAGPIVLESGSAVVQPLVFVPIQTGEDVEVIIHLFRDLQTEPYRTLRLILIVKPEL